MADFRVYTNNINNPRLPNRFKLLGTADEARTLYFALIEYRKNLHTTLQTVLLKNLDPDDFVDNEGVLHADVPQLKLNLVMDGCDEFEELMFLYDSLHHVNEMLFDIMQNHDAQTKTAVADFLDV